MTGPGGRGRRAGVAGAGPVGAGMDGGGERGEAAVLIGVLQFELLIRGAESLKDKRRVVRSVKDRLHREHQASVAEVAFLDRPQVAGLALAVVGREGRHVQSVLDRIVDKLRGLHDAELGSVRRDMLVGEQLPGADVAEDGSPLWTDQERRP